MKNILLPITLLFLSFTPAKAKDTGVNCLAKIQGFGISDEILSVKYILMKKKNIKVKNLREEALFSNGKFKAKICSFRDSRDGIGSHACSALLPLLENNAMFKLKFKGISNCQKANGKWVKAIKSRFND